MPPRRLPSKVPTAYICQGCKKFFQRKQDLKSHRKQTKKPQCKSSRPIRGKGDDGRRPFFTNTNANGTVPVPTPMEVDEELYAADDEAPDSNELPTDRPMDRRARVEDVVDEGDRPHVPSSFVTAYPSARKAGLVVRTGTPPAVKEFAHLQGDGTNPYFPFANRAEWEIAQWVKNEGISDAAFDRFNEMPSVRFPMSL